MAGAPEVQFTVTEVLPTALNTVPAAPGELASVCVETTGDAKLSPQSVNEVMNR